MGTNEVSPEGADKENKDVSKQFISIQSLHIG